MSLHQDIKSQMVEAMKAREATKLSVLRGLMASFTNELVAKKRKPDEELGDEDALSVISRAVKQRKDSIEQFEKGNRQDLADVEKAEMAILETYLPAQMSQEEVESFINDKITKENPEKDKKNQFMGLVMKELKGRTDGSVVKEALDKVWG